MYENNLTLTLITALLNEEAENFPTFCAASLMSNDVAIFLSVCYSYERIYSLSSIIWSNE